MSFFDFLDKLLRLSWELNHWRWNLGFWAGVVLAVIAVMLVPQPTWCWIVGGALFLFCAVAGWIWDERAR